MLRATAHASSPNQTPKGWLTVVWGVRLVTGAAARRNFWVLIGTASTWFLLDIAFYSQNLFLPNILEGIGYNPSIKLPIASAPCAKTHSCTTFDQQFNPEYKCTGKCAEQVYDKMFKTAAGAR